jgi:hypothetical protein
MERLRLAWDAAVVRDDGTAMIAWEKPLGPRLSGEVAAVLEEHRRRVLDQPWTSIAADTEGVSVEGLELEAVPELMQLLTDVVEAMNTWLALREGERANDKQQRLQDKARREEVNAGLQRELRNRRTDAPPTQAWED